MTTYKAIAALSENRVIGNKGTIPWHLPEDFKWFKKTTMGAILVMGRKTYESIGRPLPGRETIVLTHSPKPIEGVRVINDVEALSNLATEKTVWIAGGSEIYTALLPLCGELWLSRVHQTVEGDTFFPDFESRFTLESKLQENKDFTVERWIKNKTP